MGRQINYHTTNDMNHGMKSNVIAAACSLLLSREHIGGLVPDKLPFSHVSPRAQLRSALHRV